MPVKIHGRDYKTVAERVNELAEDTKRDYSLNTEIMHFELPKVVIKATLKIGENTYTGHALEDETKGSINSTSALENCETSAIGRALASAGYGGSEFASADEVAQAIHQQGVTPKATESRPAPKQGVRLLTEREATFIGMAKKHVDDWEKIEAWAKKPHTPKAIETTLKKLRDTCPKGFAITDPIDLMNHYMKEHGVEGKDVADIALDKEAHKRFDTALVDLSASQINELALDVANIMPF